MDFDKRMPRRPARELAHGRISAGRARGRRAKIGKVSSALENYISQEFNADLLTVV